MVRIVDGWVVDDNVQQPRHHGWPQAHPRGFQWQRPLVAAAFAAAACWTNPGWNADGFRQFLRGQRTLALAHRVAETLGLVDVSVLNLGLASLGFENERVFLGLLDQWVELPRVLLTMRLADFGWSTVHDVNWLFVAFVAITALWHRWPRAMERHCVASWPNFGAGRVWSLMAAQLAHEHTEHLLANVLFLYSVAPQVHARLSQRHFFLLYFLGGGLAILASLALTPMLCWTPQGRWWCFRRRGGAYVECLGASGSLFAMLGYLARVNAHIWWLGRRWQWAELALAQLALGALTTSTDTVAHVGGMVAGYAVADWQLLELLV